MSKKTTPFSHEHANDSSGFLLWQVTMLWQRQVVAALRSYDLTHAQFVLMAGLCWLQTRERWITQVALARHTKLDVMMTSQVLRALETRGFVKREEHPEDSRARVLTLTEAGRRLVFQAMPAVDHVDVEFFATLGTKQSGFNAALLTLIKDRLTER